MSKLNWSGWVETGGPFTYVTGSFTVPRLFSGAPVGDEMAEWVGIDDGDDSSLIQAGITEAPNPSNTGQFYIQPWWEILPHYPVSITNVSAVPGDRVTVIIRQMSGSEWGIDLTDDTNGQSFGTYQTYLGPGLSAEWIVEAPAYSLTGPYHILAPYSPAVDFTDLHLTNAPMTATVLVMTQDGIQVSTPSALTSAEFNVAYGSKAQPPP